MDKKRFTQLSVLPSFFVLLALGIYPLIEVIYLSLIDKVLTRPGTGRFYGIQNYVRLLGDKRIYNAFKVTFLWEIITVGATMLLAVLIAIFVYNNCGRRLRNALNLIFVIPVVLPRVAAAYLWRLIYSPVIGVLDYLLGLFGVKPIEFLSNSSTALVSIAFIDIWQWSLLFAVIILGILEAVQQEAIEAAYLDGANRRELHRYVMLPIIRPSLISLLFLKIVESFRTFDLIYIMTRGGPGISTETIDLYAYNTGLAVSGRISYGAAISLIMLILTLIMANFLWKVLSHEDI